MENYPKRLSINIYFFLLVIFSIVILYMKFPPTYFQDIQHGLDPSWRAAIAYAITKGLLFGTDIVFTGGPLSGIYTREFEPNTAFLVVSISAFVVLYAGYVFAILIYCNKTKYSIITSLLIVIFCPITFDALFLLIPLLASAQIIGERPKLQSKVIAAVGAFLAGILSIAKFSIFPASFAMMLVLDILAVREKKIPIQLVILFTGISVGFSLSNQPISQLFEFLKSSMQFASGYSSAMSIATKIPELFAWLTFSGLYLIFMITNSYLQRHVVAWEILTARIAVVVCFLFLAFKAGFVRQDLLHTTFAWGALSVAILITQFWASDRSYLRHMLIPIAAICAMPPLVASYRADHRLPFELDIPRQFWRQATAAGGMLFDPASWLNLEEAKHTAAMNSLRDLAPYPPLNGTVDIIQSEQSDLIGNGLDYRPRPTIQEYAAYSSELIAKNKAFFESDQAPDYLVMAPGSIDQRHPASPEGSLWPLFFSRYTPALAVHDKLILRKRATALTGVVGDSISVQAEMDQDIPVPATSAPVMASIDIKPTIIGKMLNFLYRPPMSQVSVTYEDGTSSNYRLIPDMAGQGFLLSPLVEDFKGYLLVSTGYSEYANLRKARSIRVRVGSPASSYSRHINVTFTKINNDSLQDKNQSPILTAALKQQVALLPLLKANVQNGTTIKSIPEGLFAHAPTTLQLPTNGSSFLKVSFGMLPGAWADVERTNGVCFIVRSGLDILMQRCLDPLHRAADRQEQAASIPLAANIKTLFLETDCNGDCKWDWAYWGSTEFN